MATLMTTESSCPECGASQRHGSCREQLRRALLDDLDEGVAEHLLAVACFTLQHPAAQSADSLRWARFHLEGSLVPALDRGALLQRASRHVESMSSPLGVRAAGVPIGVSWRVTVAELPELPAEPLARAHAWGRATLEDLRRA